MTQISHCLWFDTEAEQAAKFYVSVFKDGKLGRIGYYGQEGQEIHGKAVGEVMTVEFEISGQKYLALNGGPQFKFNESFSIMVSCDTQQEIDYFWQKLAADPHGGQCGWVQDKFGLWWQIIPSIIGQWMSDPDKKKSERVMKAVLQMKKIDIETLRRAHQG